jgi:hypothetical protein
LSKAQLSLADIVQALELAKSEELVPSSQDLALSSEDLVPYSEELALPGLTAGIGNRSSTPPRRRVVGKTLPQAKKPDRSYSTPEEWLEWNRSKGTLVEELYKRDGWQQLLRLTGAKSDLRKKIGTLTPEEIARLLVMLDQS